MKLNYKSTLLAFQLLRWIFAHPVLLQHPIGGEGGDGGEYYRGEDPRGSRTEDDDSDDWSFDSTEKVLWPCWWHVQTG